MRQLKGKVKESRKEKRERKEDFVANKNSCWWIVLPVLGVIASAVTFIVYYGTRPKMITVEEL